MRSAASTASAALICILFISSGWKISDSTAYQEKKSAFDISKAYRRNLAIGRGINFGNALEAPNEGEWGLTIKESYVQAIADSGFNSVRLPVCWSAHTGRSYPYSIDPAFLSRVDEVVNWCLNRNLAVIITIHHFNELYNYPDDPLYLNMFFSIWRQLTRHYLDVNHDKLFFEVLNEPEVNLTPEKWNLLMPRIIDSIRVRDSDRTLIIDAPDYGAHTSLSKLNIPKSEDNVIVSTRYYLPWQFAQQGAWWSTWTDLSQYLGTRWTATENEKNAVLADMALIKSWSDYNERPVTIGEWGSIMFADNQSRLTWTNFVRRQFDLNGFSWSYFDFGVVFKAYSIAENTWLKGFIEALTGDSEIVSDGRFSDSLMISPSKPTNNDSVKVRSYIRMPNYCSKRDSLKITVNGSEIKVKSWHREQIPRGSDESVCADTVRLGKLAPGSYTVIFDSDYLDVVNLIHYSVIDTIAIHVHDATSAHDESKITTNIYPVPATDFINVIGIGSGCMYEVWDLQGRLAVSGIIGNGRISITELKAGEYILRITDQTDAVLNKRVIVTR